MISGGDAFPWGPKNARAKHMMSSLDRKLLRDFFNLRAQTFTLALLVISGVSLLVSSWSSYRSLRQTVGNYYRDYGFADVFAEFRQAPQGLVARVREIDGVLNAEGRMTLDGQVDVFGFDEPAVGRFLSLSADLNRGLNRVHLRRGRLPDGVRLDEVVVHEGFAVAHKLQPGDRIGVLIKGQRRTLEIVGIGISPDTIYALSAAAPLPDDLHFGIFWGHARLWEEMGKLTGMVNGLSLAVAAGVNRDAVRHELDQLIKPYGGLGAYDRSRQMSNMFIQDEIRQLRVMAVFSPAIFLSIAAFLVHVIVTRLVATQRSQIATLKALGYSGSTIVGHYFKLVTLMMLAGGLPAIGLGAYLGQLMAKSYEGFFRFPLLQFDLHWPAAAIGLLLALLPGWLGAFSSLASTFRLAPAEAMRPPAPVSFQASLVERTSLFASLRMGGRMAIRNLMLRPWRVLLTVMGMAAAVAIVVMAGFWLDMIQYMLNTQFQKVQRENLSVVLIEPSPAQALLEFGHIPGVMAVEGYRIVPVRIRHRNLSRDASITAYPENARMRKPLDAKGREVVVPAEGAVLSRFFESKWGLKVGDTVRLELLEGDLRELTVTVAGFSDEMMGFGINMSLGEVRRLLQEKPLVNLVTLQIDPQLETAVYRRLKQLPMVGAVQVKTLLYRGFMKSMGGMILVSMGILLSFALCIAGGVIYNAVRVTFSERSWEIASLRVLGFTRLEVWRLLLGELLTQVSLCLIPGCLLGYWLADLSLGMSGTESFDFPVVIEPRTYAFATLTILVVFAISMIGVWRLVQKLSMVEALKARD